MSPIVRGNRLIVVQEPPSKVAQVGGSSCPQMGDKLTVGGRKKGGWLRVKNQRTGLVTTLRVGPWIAKVPHFEDGYEMPSPMDQLIRAAQVERLEDALDEKDKEIARLKMLVQNQGCELWSSELALEDARQANFAKDQEIKALLSQRDDKQEVHDLEQRVAEYQNKLSGWVERASKAEDKIEQLQQELNSCQEQLSNAIWERDDVVEREWNLRNASTSTTWGQGN